MENSVSGAILDDYDSNAPVQQLPLITPHHEDEVPLPASLLILPQELRDQIYQSVFANEILQIPYGRLQRNDLFHLRTRADTENYYESVSLVYIVEPWDNDPSLWPLVRWLAARVRDGIVLRRLTNVLSSADLEQRFEHSFNALLDLIRQNPTLLGGELIWEDVRNDWVTYSGGWNAVRLEAAVQAARMGD